MTKMKPCPFCGSEVLTTAVYGGRASFGCWESAEVEVDCHDCGAEFYIPVRIEESEENMADGLIRRLTYERGIEAWNTRAERTCTARQEFLSEHMENCLVRFSCGHMIFGLADEHNYCPVCGAKVVS